MLKTLTLVTAKNGKITVKLPKLKKGKHKHPGGLPRQRDHRRSARSP